MTEQTINILLVDDDELVLKALSRSLSRLYEHAVIVSLQHSEEFERCLHEQGEPDIIFCEVQLGAVSGLDVLSRAKVLCPCAIRCLLSGDLQEEYRFQVNDTIHFHLVKPFTLTHLQQVITNTLILKSLPLSKLTRVKLGQIAGLPCLTASISGLMEALQHGSPDINELVELLNHDPALVGKLLQIANSAFMGYQTHTADVKEAIVRIGLVALKALVTCYEMSQLFINRLKQAQIEALIDEALEKALMVKSLTRYLKQSSDKQQNAFACCLLSAVGVLTKECVLPRHASNSVSSYALAAYLLALWGFDESLVRAQLVNDLPPEPYVSLTLLHAISEQVTQKKAFDLTPELYSRLQVCAQYDAVKAWYQEREHKVE
ncbi:MULTISPECIES: HDOD domain-containing protein [Pseudoalteromonas]|uniref:Response regulator n=1 Tax=Pseudoalteromonas amylolytica TaxID=1859457 RepID=A0A1S1MQ00_9GAMM|nr:MULTISPECIES: HDOD domain-containing protein [Pseudoalteromonas]OHU84363.1 hypothetical protein BFC16_01615 [Pseudoalteromonas sp. JW3]OHU87098.1 hypothetical protein BET10_00325 [Pseudoalteromonas amylolytica]